jgi:hypothetical protein
MNKTQIGNSRKFQNSFKESNVGFTEILEHAEQLPKAEPSTVNKNGVVPPPADFARLGRIVEFRDGSVYIDFEGNDHGPRIALTTVPLRNLEDAVVVLLLPNRQPVIVGQLYSSALVDSDVLITGRTVRIEAESELILRSGTSKIHLDARGRLVTSADHVLSRARAANKVQGGSVQIN